MAEDLKARITTDMKTAMKAKASDQLGTIRMLMAAIKQREVDERITLDNGAILSVINKMIKQRRESIKQFEAANRQELADKEKQEIEFLTVYLPEPLSDSEIDAAIQAAVSSTGAETMKDMGKVMGMLKGQLEGRADMGTVSQKIKALLS